MKSVAILQSSYIPWKGYFDLIGKVDEFILLDDVQFTKRDWRSRNLIKTPAVSMRIGELAMTGVAVPIEDLTEITRVHELFRQKYLRARMAEWIGSDTGRGKVVQLGELTQLP